MIRLPASAMRRWPILVLVASLLLNAFLIGMMLTDALRHNSRGEGPRVIGWELRRLARQLPPEALDRLRADLAPVSESFDERFQALRAQREAINRMAAEPDPDRPAIDAQLAEMRAGGERLQADVQRATYDALLRLPADMRARLADPPDSG